MRTFSQKIKVNRTLLAQLIFTLLAFIAMAVLSYIFMSDIVREGLVRNANGVISLTEARIEAYLLECETTMDGFAEETRAMLLRGDSVGQLQEYIEDVSRFSYIDGSKTSGIQDFYGYFETIEGGPTLIRPSNSNISADAPEKQSWFQKAVATDGIVETTPYINHAGLSCYTYAKRILDERGRRLGVVCMNVILDRLGRGVVDTALDQGGYGMLGNQDGLILFHPNEAFKGINAKNSIMPIHIYADDILAGSEIVEQPMMSYRGEDSVIFFRTLSNGWHLGLVIPKSQYYQGTTNMGIIIVLLAAALACTLIIILIRLDAARAKSDEESRQKSAFLANMSHEIRTPINAIVGMTAIGRTSAAPDRKNYCFMKIDDASRHLLGVINDVLDMSKIEANKIELSSIDFHFEKMLQQVVNVINFRIDEKHQKLSVYIDKNIPKVLHADDHRIAQVITNLLGNAVKFTPDNGSISLIARLIGEENGVLAIEIEVTDNGIGITDMQIGKLFQSFRQAESSTTRKYGGTGLGLAISKSIVELMGGKIWVESEFGQGSTFTFTIKAKRGDDKKYGLAYENINWGNIRILTVDDDRDILEYFHEIVKGYGANCEVAAGAGEALQLLDTNGEYNIYFVDLKMPDVDGIALTKEIRAREKTPGNSIVIMISSADLSAVEDEARKAGVDKFLIKPIFPSAIADTISECIGIVNDKMDEEPSDLFGIFEGYHILFAEDIDINREIVLALLEPTHLAIDCAENGMQAVNMFIKAPEKYDLILMDVQMPEMDGYEATRQIRSLDISGAADIPIIAMTANVFKEDVEKCLAAGMNNHLSKPLDFDEVIRTLALYLRLIEKSS